MAAGRDNLKRDARATTSVDEAADASRAARTLRATQTIVSHMSFSVSHPSVVLLEIGWRWLFGIPFLALVRMQVQQILLRIPPEAAGLDRLNYQNPWISSVLLVDASGIYHPAVASLLGWLLPAGAVVWAIVSGMGRALVLWRINSLDASVGATRGWRSRSVVRWLPGMIVLQAVWMAALLGCFWLWYQGVAWAARTHITSSADPDLIGYLCWLIFLSLGIFTAWSLLSWILAVAPILFFQEGDLDPVQALAGSLQLGKAFSGKLMEVNLVMGIVKITLIVLAMVFSAAPLPFSDEFGQSAMHLLYWVIAVAFLIGNDFFHVVRLKSFVELWRYYRGGPTPRPAALASTAMIDLYPGLQKELTLHVLDHDWAFFSDESSLWDFTEEASLASYYAKIRETFGVDASDVEGATIWKILERIAEHRRRTR